MKKLLLAFALFLLAPLVHAQGYVPPMDPFGPSATEPFTCDADTNGQKYRNTTTNTLHYCNGTNWVKLVKNSVDGVFDYRGPAVSIVAAPTVTPQGTPGATTYGYRIVAIGLDGIELGSVRALSNRNAAPASQEGTTGTGNATLNGTDFNRVTWSAATNALTYNIYRTTGGASPPKMIGTTSALTFDDTGAAGTATIPPEMSRTGFLQLVNGAGTNSWSFATDIQGVGGTSDQLNNFMLLYGAFPATQTTSQHAARMVMSATGSATFSKTVFEAEVSGAFSGAAHVEAIHGLSYTSGTGNTLGLDGSAIAANVGVFGEGGGTSLLQVGTIGRIGTGATTGIGVMGLASGSVSNSGVGVFGVAGVGAGGVLTNQKAVGVAAFLSDSSGIPTFVATALLADNTDNSTPIIIGRDNGTEVFRVDDGGSTILTQDPSSTNTVVNELTLTRTSSGTPAIGMGVSESAILENASGTNRIVSVVDTTYVDPVNATEDVDWHLQTITNGALTTKLTIGSSGHLITAGSIFMTTGDLNLGATRSINWGSNELLLNREAAAVLQLGFDVNGAAVAQTIKSHDGITGTDIAGANLTIAAGRGTGAGAPGTLTFQTPTTLGTGTTPQTLTTRATMDENNVTLMSNNTFSTTTHKLRAATGAGVTFTGPTADRIYTLPDSAATLATGTGTTNTLPKFTTGASGILGNSTITDDGTTVALNTNHTFTSSTHKLRAATGAGVTFTGPTADRIYTLPDAADTIETLGSNQTVTGTKTYNVGPVIASGAFIEGTEAAAPSTPAAGQVRLYAKSGTPGEFCSKDDAGTETCMSAGSGGSGITYADAVAAVLAGF